MSEAAILKDDEGWLKFLNGSFGLKAESLDVAVGALVCCGCSCVLCV